MISLYIQNKGKKVSNILHAFLSGLFNPKVELSNLFYLILKDSDKSWFSFHSFYFLFT